MKIAIMQPYFFPYLGYYQLVNAVDAFIFFDDVHFINKGWINRNQLWGKPAAYKFTVPLKAASQNKLIKDIELDAFEKWSNGTWHNINTPSVDGGWGVDISFFIFPIICDKFESVNEIAKSMLDDVVVFPNPASNEVFINLSNLKYSTLNLYDVTGNNVAISLKNNSNEMVSFDVSQLTKGIYFVEIKNNGYKSIKKLVIN